MKTAAARAFEDFWAVVQARYDGIDALHGPAGDINRRARAANEARLRRHFGLADASGDDIRDQMIRARYRARFGEQAA